MDDNGGRCGFMARCLVGASEYFLRQRNFDGCRKYALKAREADPHSVTAAQILGVADVLSASQTRVNNIPYDWYAILGVSRYSHDSEVIRNQFKELILLLSPSKNKFIFASHAFALVRSAWAVLSSPSRKSQFDNELKIFESVNELKDHLRAPLDAGGPEFLKSTGGEEKMEEKGASSDKTFWTICPYCYYVYEYLRVYEDCCLRCQNHQCRRGFHAVVIPPPTARVAESAEYWCLGFFPLWCEGGEGKGCSPWSPFMPVNMVTPWADVKEQMPVPKGVNEDGTRSFIEISDDSDDLHGASGETPMDANTKIAQTVEEAQKVGQSSHGPEAKITEREAVNVPKPAMKRKKKSMAKGIMKLNGKGIRVKLNEALPSKIRGLDLNVEGCEDDDDIGHGLVRGKDMGDEAEPVLEMEFFEGDNDIFVSLRDGF